MSGAIEELNNPIVSQQLNPTFGSLGSLSTVGAIKCTLTAPLSLGPSDVQTSELDFVTSNATGSFFRLISNNGTGGGLVDGCLQLFSYNDNTQLVYKVIPGTAGATTSATMIFGADINMGASGVNYLPGSSGLRCYRSVLPALTGGGTGSGAVITNPGDLGVGLYQVYTDHSGDVVSAPYELSTVGYFDGTNWRGLGSTTFGNDGIHFSVMALSSDRTAITVNNNSGADFAAGYVYYVQLGGAQNLP